MAQDFDDEQATSIIQVDTVQSSDEEQSSAYFIVLAGANVGEMYKLDSAEMTLGRSRDADVRIVDEGISRRHCRVISIPTGDVMIEDLHSSNGTYANGKRIRTHILQDGDKVQIGSTTILKFTYSDDLDENFQRQMYEAALRDGLTKAFNKKYFHDRLHAEFAYASRHKSPLTLLMMDLDHFKHFNDTYGHLAGDHVLESLSQRVHSSIRTEDVFARYGGEEFALICRAIPLADGAIVGERIRSLMANTPFHYDGHVLAVTISVGVAGVPSRGIETPDDLIAAADKALYEAKESGRNRVVIQGQLDDA
jgi:diguanylate cyclase (GGDEF)-like protein